MAVVPIRKPPPKGSDDPDNPLIKQMRALIRRAEIDRNRHQSRIADCYKYAMPWRHGFNSTTPGNQYDQIYDESVSTILEDFAADMLNTFTPQRDNWLEEETAKTFDKTDRRQMDDQLARRQNVVFAEMGRSNLYQALQEGYLDLGPGTMALLIMDIGADQPIKCEAIPATDLLIIRGPYGFVSGTFRRKTYMRSDVEELWPDADLELIGPKPEDATSQELEITDGCWRDWADKADETYNYVVECHGKILYQKTWKGAGSCPFIVARWSRDSTTAWGVGPTYRTLPAIKTLNAVRLLDLKNYDKYVDPVTSYPDDGVFNLDNGINPGDWIPRAPGSDAPEVIESKAKFDVAIFERDELRSTIRKAHYQDQPEQLGKTPPSATQWADERAERSRRMGTPATNLVQELQIPIYQRFVYLLEQRGTLPKVEFEGQDIALVPVSPLLRAQQQEEVVRNDKFAELIVGRFGPQVGMIVIDLIKYAGRQGELLGIDPAIIRNEADMKNAIETLMPVLKATGFLPGSTPDIGVPPALPAA